MVGRRFADRPGVLKTQPSTTTYDHAPVHLPLEVAVHHHDTSLSANKHALFYPHAPHPRLCPAVDSGLGNSPSPTMLKLQDKTDSARASGGVRENDCEAFELIFITRYYCHTEEKTLCWEYRDKCVISRRVSSNTASKILIGSLPMKSGTSSLCWVNTQ